MKSKESHQLSSPEHMEEDQEGSNPIPRWVELEYLVSSSDASVHFTNLSERLCAPLAATLASSTPTRRDSVAATTCHTEGILDLLQDASAGIDQVCLLDPQAEHPLSPEDGDGRFSFFLFGGILGDDPPRDRTAQLRNLGFPRRHLGSVQMTTDTALYVTKLVVQDKVPLNDIPYIDYPTIRFNARESVEMPFRYVADGSEPTLPPGMKRLLQDNLDESIEF